MSLDPQRYQTNSAFFQAIVNTLKENKNDPNSLSKILVQSGSILLLQTESIIEFLDKYIPEKLASFDGSTQQGARDRAEFAATLLNFFNILPQLDLPPIMPFKTEVGDKDYNHFQEVSIKGIETLLTAKESPFNASRLENNPQLAVTLAQIQTHLISLYLQRLYGSKEENCKKAIQVAKRSLKVLSPEKTPKEYIQVQSLIGVAYKKLAQSTNDEKEKQKAFDESIRAYEAIVQSEFVKKNDIQTWAATNNNLANTYLEMAGSEMLIDILDPSNNEEIEDVTRRASLIDKATTRFAEAVKLFDKTEQSLQWSTMQLNLGYSHLSMVHLLFVGAVVNSNQQTNLMTMIPGAISEAKKCFNEALTVIKPSAQRGAEWARIKIFTAECDLYEFLFVQSEPDKRMDKLHEIVESLKSACKIFSSKTGPTWFARAQYHLGTIYEFLARQCRQDEKEAEKDLKQKSLECFQEVNDVYTILRGNSQAKASEKILSHMRDRIDMLKGDLEKK